MKFKGRSGVCKFEVLSELGMCKYYPHININVDYLSYEIAVRFPGGFP